LRSLGAIMKSTSRHLAAALAVVVSIAAIAPAGAQDERLELFDAHMHYNQEPNPFYSLKTVLDVFRRNNVTGVLATSRPNKGTHQLVEAKAPGLWVVPFIRPYRIRADIGTWFSDPATLDLIRDEYKRGYFQGIGEFHISGQAAAGSIVKQVVDFAVERNLYLHCHCDDTALLHLFAHNAKARIIWAHTGFSTPPSRVDELLRKHPALWGELSYRNGLTESDGSLAPDWRALLIQHRERFLIGSDTWINERWFGYHTIIRGYRAWLSQLPREVATAIANGNAKRLFGGKPLN
jgi:hypothetical protein